VKAVWTGDEWELHFVCKVEIEVSESPGEKTVGIDLGINNFAALAYENGHSERVPAQQSEAGRLLLQQADRSV